MVRNVFLTVILLITVFGQSWAEPQGKEKLDRQAVEVLAAELQAVKVKDLQNLLDSNPTAYQAEKEINQKTEKREWRVDCKSEPEQLKLKEKRLAFYLNQGGASYDETNRRIVLNQYMPASVFEDGMSEEARDARKAALQLRAEQEAQATLQNNRGIAIVITFGIFAIAIGRLIYGYRKSGRHRGLPRAYGYGLSPSETTAIDEKRIEKKLTDNADKRFKVMQDAVDEVSKEVAGMLDKALQDFRLEFAPTPKKLATTVLAIDPDKPVDPKDIAKQDPTPDPEEQIAAARQMGMIPFPDSFSRGIIEAEAETPAQTTQIIPDEIVEMVNVEPEEVKEVERKNDSADDEDDLVGEVVDDLPASFMECEDTDVKKVLVGTNGHGNKKGVFL